MNVTDYLGKRYEAECGYKLVIGVITEPAITLRNPITGETETVVVGSLTHEGMTEISDDDALSIAERKLLWEAAAKDG
jgi:hypothetical protein